MKLFEKHSFISCAEREILKPIGFTAPLQMLLCFGHVTHGIF